MTGFQDHGYTFMAQQPIINIGGTAVLQDARSAQLSSYANEDSLGGKGIFVQEAECGVFEPHRDRYVDSVW